MNKIIKMIIQDLHIIIICISILWIIVWIYIIDK